MVYKLSCTLVGHSKDVRAVASGIADGQIITGSRDCTAKLWKARADGETGYEEINSLSGHSKYVSVVTMYPPSDDYPTGLILTGSHDGIIRAYRPDGSTPEFTLEGHSQTVSSLYVGKFHTLVSGSWDTTAKVWNEKKQIMTLSGHQAAVWSVAILPQVGIMLTGSADKTIKMWKAGSCQKTLSGHEDCIRDLAVLSVNEFLSCANDCVVKRWSVESGECTATYHGHENYIYSLALMPNGVDFVTSGEDRTVRVWTNGEVSQTIQIPAQSVWCVTVLPSGDIAAGASDGKVWLFSQNASRQAPEELQAIYEDELSKQQLAAKTELGGVKMSDIPGPESLLEPGRRDGQTKMVREGNSVSVHSWSAQEQKWSKIGDVVGAPEQNKKLYEGKEYDYVFDIDIDEPKMVLKLPYNTVDDPWMTAQKFIHKHDLSQHFLDQIANFIIQNTKGEKLGTGSSGMGADPLTGDGAYVAQSVGTEQTNGGMFVDPFTGSGAYVSGSGGVEPSRRRLTGAPDPLTGGGAYTSDSNGPAPMDVDNTFFPQTTFLGFNQKPNPAAMVNKLKQLNAGVSEEFKIESDDLLERLPNLGLPDADSTSADVTNLIKVLGWPLDKTFPALDILRLAVKNPKVNETLLNAELVDNLVSLLLQSIEPVAPDACQMLALRTMANMFSVEAGKAVLLKMRDPIITRLAHMLPRENKNVQIAMSTVMINYAVALSTSPDPLEGQVQCVSVISLLFLEGIIDPEAKFRTLVALGTLLQGSPENIEYAKSMEVVPRLKSWKLTAEDTPKVVQCADFILQML